VETSAWAVFGLYSVVDMVHIHTAAGNYDAALDQLEQLLTVPSLVSVPRIQIDPRLAPLRDHPRFTELLDSKS